MLHIKSLSVLTLSPVCNCLMAVFTDPVKFGVPFQTAPSCVIDLRDEGSDTPMEIDSTDVDNRRALQDEAHVRSLLLQLFSTNAGKLPIFVFT